MIAMHKPDCVYYEEVQKRHDLHANISVCTMVSNHNLKKATKFNCEKCKYYTTPNKLLGIIEESIKRLPLNNMEDEQ